VLLKFDPGSRLLDEARHSPLIFQEPPLERLDGDRIAPFVIEAQVNDAHAAANHAADFVAGGNRVADPEIARIALFGVVERG